MEEKLIQINVGITINVDVNVKNVIYMKKIIFGIQLWKLKYLASIMNDSAIICDEVIEPYNTKPTNFNEKKKNAKLLYFVCIFINHYTIIDSC